MVKGDGIALYEVYDSEGMNPMLQFHQKQLSCFVTLIISIVFLLVPGCTSKRKQGLYQGLRLVYSKITYGSKTNIETEVSYELEKSGGKDFRVIKIIKVISPGPGYEQKPVKYLLGPDGTVPGDDKMKDSDPGNNLWLAEGKRQPNTVLAKRTDFPSKLLTVRKEVKWEKWDTFLVEYESRGGVICKYFYDKHTGYLVGGELGIFHGKAAIQKQVLIKTNADIKL